MDANNRSQCGHWTDDDFLRRLYGLDTGGLSLAHLASCPDCRQRFERLQTRRNDVLAVPPVDEERLRTQRQAIWALIETRRRHPWLSWKVPAAATALVVMLAFLVSRPAGPVAEDPLIEIAEMASPQPVSDTQFFEEIAQVASSTQPRGAEAVESLFDGGGD